MSTSESGHQRANDIKLMAIAEQKAILAQITHSIKLYNFILEDRGFSYSSPQKYTNIVCTYEY